MRDLLRACKHWLIHRTKFVKRIGLKGKTFSIISNNCTGGYIYQYYGIEYNSPTAGLIFDAADYLKICKDPQKYFSVEPVIISAKECSHAGFLSELQNWGSYPIGKIDDVEVYFMHYPTAEEAISKWKRRCKRVDYSHMIFLLTQNESCTEEIIRQFLSLPMENKICLTYDKLNIPGTIYSEEVHNIEGHPWRPEIIEEIVDWKEIINRGMK